MPYLYGVTDDKHVPSLDVNTKQKLKPLDTYKFKVCPLLEGKKKIKAGEAAIRFKATPDTLVELASLVVNAIPLPQPFQWRTLEVADWIRKLGFPQYQNTFKKNYINGRTLLRMDASNLIKINIKDYDHIRTITNSIRHLYKFNKSSFKRSISMPDRTPDALYKFFRTRNGPKYQKTRRTDLYRRLHLLRPRPLYETHWLTLERWIKHLRPIDIERIGGTIQKPYNLYYPPKPKRSSFQKKSKISCDCMPPCICGWKPYHFRQPWKLNCLRKVAQQAVCPPDCKCVATCTCGWPKAPMQKGLTILRVHAPNRYAIDDTRISVDRYAKVRFSAISI